MININDNNYKEQVSKNSNLVVLFWAPWCSQCPSMYPVVDQIDKNYKDITVAKCDTEESNDFINEVNVMSLPYIGFFKNGQCIKSLTGRQPLTAVEDQLKSLFELQIA